MLKRWILILPMLALVGVWGCSDDDKSPTATEDSAFEAMAAAGAALINGTSFIVPAATVAPNIATYTVLDIRSASDYALGHIDGAYNTSLATLMADLGTRAFPEDKPFLVTCYSGQTAGHAAFALRLLGYEAYSLKWGMADWNSSLSGTWTSHCGDALTTPETTNNNGGLEEHPFPTELDDYDADTVVEERVEEMLAAGFQGIDYTTVAADPDAYFILNYFGQADYLGSGTAGVPGHIPGAYQFTPGQSLGMDQMLDNLPPDMPIVVYCWTGQNSSQVAFYLNCLGYEAYSLRWGANGLFHSDLVAGGTKWDTGGSANGFDLVTE